MKVKALLLFLLIVMTVPAAVSRERANGGGAANMARKLQDPLANIAAVMTDNDILFNTGNDNPSYSFQFQPVYAFDFAQQGFTFIPRGIIPIIGAAPASELPILGEQRPRGDGTTWGLGDIVTQFFFAPKLKTDWKWGAGPQFSWKTRTDFKIGPYWNVVKPDGGADWLLKCGATMIFPK